MCVLGLLSANRKLSLASQESQRTPTHQQPPRFPQMLGTGWSVFSSTQPGDLMTSAGIETNAARGDRSPTISDKCPGINDRYPCVLNVESVVALAAHAAGW